MKYYLKQSVFLILYNIFMTIIARAILCIQGDDLAWLKILLCVLNIALYLFIVFMTMYAEGGEALKVRHANDLNRREIIRTGEDLPLKLNEEYKPWKGFLIGFLIGSPIIICLIIHTILCLASGGTLIGAGVVSSILYMAFFAPVTVLLNVSVLAWGHYYIVLYTIPVIMAVAGLSYLFGGKKIQAQYDKIEQKQREIYGN